MSIGVTCDRMREEMLGHHANPQRPSGVDLDTLLSQSDIVCVHTPLDVDTKALIDGPHSTR